MNTRTYDVVLDVENPWPGLLSFPDGAERYFNGRERERDELLRLIRREPLTLLYGQSGLGKTSLLLAGLFPALRRERYLPVYVRIDYAQPDLPAGEQLLNLLFAACEREGVDAEARAETETLWQYLHRKRTEFWSSRNQPVIPVFVIDQFEEIVTLGRSTPEARARSSAFLTQLADLINNTPPQPLESHLQAHPEEAAQYAFRRREYRIVLGAREDFVPELEQLLRGLTASLMQNSVRLNRMSGEQAFEAIERTGGHLVSEDVAHRIVRFLAGRGGIEHHDVIEARLEIEPALLSVFCRGLNDARKQRGLDTIEAELLGGSKEDILAGYYTDAVSGLAPGMRQLVEEELLTEGGYRNSCALDDALRMPDVTQEGIDTLVARRLVRLEERFGVLRVELTHDVLTGIVRASRDRHRAEQAESARRAQERARTEELERVAAGARRQRALYAAAAMILLVFAVVASTFAVKEKRAREAANAAQDQSDRARLTAASMRDRAEASFRQASATADRLTLDVLDKAAQDMRIPGQALEEVIRITDQALSGLTSSPDRAQGHAGFLATAGNAYVRLGRFDDALAYARRSLAILDTLSATSEQRRLIRAEAQYAAGAALFAKGRLSEAKRELTQSITLAKAGRSVDRTRSLRLRVEAHWQLAELERLRLTPAASLVHAKEIGVLVREAGSTVDANAVDEWRALALLAQATVIDDDDEASRLFRRAADMLDRVRARDPDNLRLAATLVWARYVQGFRESGIDRVDSARVHLYTALELARLLTRHDPSNLDWRWRLATVHRGLGAMASQVDWNSAEQSLDSARVIMVALIAQQPNWQRAVSQQTNVLTLAGDVARNRYEGSPRRDAGYLQKAAELYQQALAVAQRGTSSAPEYAELARALALAQDRLARTYRDRGDRERAQAFAAAATRTIEAVVRRNPTDKTLLSTEQSILRYYASVLPDSTHARTKEPLLHRARVITEQLLAQRGTRELLLDLADIRNSLGVLKQNTGNLEGALAEYNSSVSALDQAVKRFGPNPAVLRQKARFAYRNRSLVRLAQGQHERALDDLDAAVDITARALETAWADATLLRDLKDFARDARGMADRIGNGQIKASTSLTDLRTRALAVAERSERMVSTTIERSGGGWLMPPLIPGSWRTLSAAERQPEVERLRGAGVNSLRSASIGRVRKLDLPFYHGGALFEAEVLGRDQPGLIDYIRYGDRIVVLDGSSPPIHELNRAAPVRITNREQAAAYLRFFVAAIQSDGGRFSWADQVDDLPWLPEASTAQRDSVRRQVRPLVLEEDPSGLGWRARGSVVYSRVLFTNTFRLYQDGYTEMVNDEPVRTDLAVTTEKFRGSIRSVTNRNVIVLDSLRQEIAKANRRARMVFDADSFAAAVVAGQGRVAGWRQVNILAATDSSKTELARALGSLAWYLLFARRPAEALEAAEEALRTAPAQTWIESNRAHALVQLERPTEAARVYREYLGKEVDGQPWEQLIRVDLGDLQKKGVFTAAQVELVEEWINGKSP